MRVGIICSVGGHLTEGLACLDAFADAEKFLVVQNLPGARNLQLEGISKIHKLKVFFGYSMKMGVPFSLFWSLFSFVRIFLKERPQVLFSTGAEVALPAFLIGKIFFRTKNIYLESFTRVQAPSMTAKYIAHWSDLFLVQQESLLPLYDKRAKYQGSLI